MTDYAEEQLNELETLRSIYTEEEFTEVSEDPPCFQICVQSSDENGSVSVDVQFTYTPTYPDEVPKVAVTSHTGLSEQQVEELEAHLNDLASENLGMVMIFTLVSGAQDKLVDNLDALRKEKERILKEKEEELQRLEEAKFFGTPVTRENFLEWRRKFDEEMKLSRPSSSAESVVGLTGRQMFERDSSLALSDARFLTEVSEPSETPAEIEEAQDNVEVDESLFQDLEDLQV